MPVEKVWADQENANGERPDFIIVKLMAQVEGGPEKEVDRILLRPGNKWKYTFTDLPMKEDGKNISYRVEEVPLEGYTATITGNAQEGFTITNRPKTPTQVDPPKYPNPPKPNKPIVNPPKYPKPSKPALPKTGDGISPSHLAMGTLALGCGLVGLGLRRRRHVR